MALFKKDNKEEAVSATEKTVKKAPAVTMSEDLSWVLQAPRLTEKAAIKTSDGVYTFNVHDDANKIQIKKAITAIYKVTPVKVNIIKNKPEKIFARGRRGVKKGFKKAMVFLKKGDTIEFA